MDLWQTPRNINMGLKKYLIIKHSLYGIYMLDEITKKHLLDLKDGMIECIINTQTQSYFDVKSNEWKTIKDEEVYESNL